MRIAEHYDRRQKIGVGGMGTVYLGTDTRDATPVAIKELKPEVMQTDPGQLQRFIREGELLRRLNHPNIVKILDFTEQDNHYYLVMEYVDGGSLLDVLQTQGQLSIQRVLYIALDLADALTRAHRLNVLHRDIKPANVLIAADGTPRLTDFGMARQDDSEVTQEGMVIGTLAYLSPEALRGDVIDERSDIWSFGVMLYEMLAGDRPFGKTTSAGELVTSIMTKPIPDIETVRSGLPTALVDLINRMLARDLHARIPSVRLVGAELEALIRHGATSSMQAVITVDESTGRFATDNFTPPQTSESGIRPSSNFPTQPTPFVGREPEREAITALLGTQRIITLIGPGGIGKSRLAQAVAEANIDRYPDGAFFVSLAALEQPELLPQTIGDAIGFGFAGGSDPINELICHLEDKRLLLVLDNFEHMMDAADTVAEIIKDAPHVTVIITSRERLRLRGEQIYDVTGFPVPHKEQSLDDLSGECAVILFQQSAQRIMPGFALDADNAPHIIDIIEMVQGLPLGIELAAAWLETLPIDEIVQEIESSLDFLETDLRDVPDRHRSIRAVFEYSWNMLTDVEKDAFMKLSIFRGGFEREAASKVTGASLRTLTTLTNKSLIRRDPKGRYFMHKLLRQYAEEQFATGCRMQDEVYGAHATYYGEMIHRVAPSLDTRKELDAFDIIDTEIENIRAALRWSVKQQQWQKLNDVVHVIGMYYRARGLLREGEAWFRELAEIAQAQAPDKALYWRARVYQAMLLTQMGDHMAAQDYATQAADYFQAHDLKHYYAASQVVLSDTYLKRSDYEAATQHATNSLNVFDTPPSPIWFTAMANIAYAQYLRGNYPEAEYIYKQLTERCETEEHSPTYHADAMNQLGEVLRAQGKNDIAMEKYKAAYDTYKAYRDKRGMASALNNLAGIVYIHGDHTTAKAKYEEAYRLNRLVGDRDGLGHSLSALGNIAISHEQFDEAERFFTESLQSRRSLNDRRGEADSLADLARITFIKQEISRAEQYIQQAREIYADIGDQVGVAMSILSEGIAQLELGNDITAKQQFETALEQANGLKDYFLSIQAITGLARLALKEGRIADARRMILDLLRDNYNQNMRPLMVTALVGMARVFVAEDQPARAAEIIGLLQDESFAYVIKMKDSLKELETTLRQQLNDSDYEVAYQRGEAMILNDYVEQLIAHDRA